MRTKAFDIVVDEKAAPGGELVAYASTFDREPDSAGDVVARGAFAETLAEWRASGSFIPLLFGHRMDDPMMNLGRVVEAEEDARGLLVRAEFDEENENAQYVRKLVREGRLSKMSFAYDILDEAPVVLADGRKANELRKLKLHEVSLVPVPANQHADVLDVKSTSVECDTLEMDDDIEDFDSAETSVALDIEGAPSTKAPGEEDDRTRDEQRGAEAPDWERLASMLVAMSDRLDAMSDTLDDIAEGIVLMLPEPQADGLDDMSANGAEAVIADDGDKGEAAPGGNPEVSIKRDETLSAMARYVAID